MPSRISPLRPTFALAAALLAGACYQDPQQVMDQQQAITDMTDALNQMGFQMAELQATVDSLSGIVARQDTTIYRMANVTGVPYQLR